MSARHSQVIEQKTIELQKLNDKFTEEERLFKIMEEAERRHGKTEGRFACRVGEQKGDRPLHFCPLPFCLGLFLNVRRHFLTVHKNHVKDKDVDLLIAETWRLTNEVRKLEGKREVKRREDFKKKTPPQLVREEEEESEDESLKQNEEETEIEGTDTRN